MDFACANAKSEKRGPTDGGKNWDDIRHNRHHLSLRLRLAAAHLRRVFLSFFFCVLVVAGDLAVLLDNIGCWPSLGRLSPRPLTLCKSDALVLRLFYVDAISCATEDCRRTHAHSLS